VADVEAGIGQAVGQRDGHAAVIFDDEDPHVDIPVTSAGRVAPTVAPR
jgi:hypothetical protein